MKNGNVRCWAIHINHDYQAEILEVEDVMQCIREEGDRGWVRNVDNFQEWIANFNDLAVTKEEATQKWIERLTLARDKINLEIEKWTTPSLKEVK